MADVQQGERNRITLTFVFFCEGNVLFEFLLLFTAGGHPCVYDAAVAVDNATAQTPMGLKLCSAAEK